MPHLLELTERQARLFVALASVVARHTGRAAEVLQKPRDEDIVDAAAALAATLETAARGIVYDHQPASLPAARIASEMKQLIEEAAEQGGSGLERDAAVALRRLEQAARQAVKDRRDSDEFQRRLARLLSVRGEESPPLEPRPSRIIP